jgi:hypothetical protein
LSQILYDKTIECGKKYTVSDIHQHFQSNNYFPLFDFLTQIYLFAFGLIAFCKKKKPNLLCGGDEKSQFSPRILRCQLE